MHAQDGWFLNVVSAVRVECSISAILSVLSPYAIDKELLKFGIPIGSFALADLVGLDVGLDVDAVKAGCC